MQRPDGPRIEARGVHLRPITEPDLPRLRMAEFFLPGASWRSRGATPSPSQFADLVWVGSLTQLLAFATGLGDDAPDELVGWFQLYEVEHHNGIGSLGAANFLVRPDPRFGIAPTLFIDYVFDTWSLRKLYLELPAHNAPSVAAVLDAPLVREGLLTDRLFHGGRFIDVGIYSLGRDDWAATGVSGKI